MQETFACVARSSVMSQWVLLETHIPNHIQGAMFWILFAEWNPMNVRGAKLSKPQYPTTLEVFAFPPEWSHLRKTRVIKQYLVSTFLLWGRYLILVYHEYQIYQMFLNPQVVLLPFYLYVLGGWCEMENTITHSQRRWRLTFRVAVHCCTGCALHKDASWRGKRGPEI